MGDVLLGDLKGLWSNGLRRSFLTFDMILILCLIGSTTFVYIHDWAHTIVPRHLCAQTHLCPNTNRGQARSCALSIIIL